MALIRYFVLEFFKKIAFESFDVPRMFFNFQALKPYVLICFVLIKKKRVVKKLIKTQKSDWIKRYFCLIINSKPCDLILNLGSKMTNEF